MNFSASLMPANYSVQLYGAPAHLYRAWITRDAPGSPRVAISGFEFEAQLDINIAKIDFSAIIGKKIFLNLYMSVAEETEAVHSLAVRCSIGSSSRSPIYEDKIEEKQSIHVTLMPGYRKRFVWKPQEVDLDDYGTPGTLRVFLPPEILVKLIFLFCRCSFCRNFQPDWWKN